MWSKSPFGSASHFANIVSWKAGSPTSNPKRLKAESVRLFVDLKQTQCKTTEIKINILQFKSWILDTAELVEHAAALRDLKLLVGSLDNSSLLRGLVYMEMWATFAICHSKCLWRPQTKKSLIETSLWQAWVWVAWIERGQQIWVQKIYAEKSFKSITDSQLKHRPWRCSGWIVTPNSIIHPYRFSDLFMSWTSLLERIAGIWRECIP